MKPNRLHKLPDAFRKALMEARAKRGWSQLELGRRVGLPQMHVSTIETGKTVPRVDTLLEIVRVLGLDLVMVPRELVPAVKGLVRDYRRQGRGVADDDGERSLYADDSSDTPTEND